MEVNPHRRYFAIKTHTRERRGLHSFIQILFKGENDDNVDDDETIQ